MNLETFILAPRLWKWGGATVFVDGSPLPGEDCTTFSASWVDQVSGIDPAADLRGTYSTAKDANAIVATSGGIVALIGGRIEPLGWYRSKSPVDGDIGIVEAVSGVDGILKHIPAIRFGPLWAVMSPRGAMVKQLDWTGVAWHSP